MDFAEPIKEMIQRDEIALADAEKLQEDIDQRLASARKSILMGQGITADDAYFENLKARAILRRKI